MSFTATVNYILKAEDKRFIILEVAKPNFWLHYCVFSYYSAYSWLQSTGTKELSLLFADNSKLLFSFFFSPAVIDRLGEKNGDS